MLDGFDRRRRVEGDTGFDAERPDHRQGPVEVPAHLNVDGHDVGASR